MGIGWNAVEYEALNQDFKNRGRRIEEPFDRDLEEIERAAERSDARVAMVGILPTLGRRHLTLEHMSPLQRFRALNEQILRLRAGCPIELNIRGRDHLHVRHSDVMLESAATSFQIHLKVTAAEAGRVYNASKILSAPMVAVSANSPYLFGRDLWDETRIPLFEQSVAVGGLAGASHGPLRRVTFGSGYARSTLYECFLENQQHYPVLLPMRFNEGVERMAHLRLHNGTIWRWNRPLIGFDYDGIPHLRIEHRVVPGGPTIVDVIGNAALFFGLIQMLIEADEPAEAHIPFAIARDNFYAAARHGLDAHVTWRDGEKGVMRALLQQLLPLARTGLERLEIDRGDIERYLGVIEGRMDTGQTGTAWQRAWVARHGRDMAALTVAYLERQDSGRPVHEWGLEPA